MVAVDFCVTWNREGRSEELLARQNKGKETVFICDNSHRVGKSPLGSICD